MGNEPARKLAHQYYVITLGGALILAIIVATLFFGRFSEQMQLQIRALEEKGEDRAAGLDSFMAVAPRYVTQLQATMTYHLDRESGDISDLGVVPLIRDYDGDYFALDAPPTDRDLARLGNLIGFGPPSDRLDTDRDRRELHAAVNLFPLFQASHQTHPHFTWSYYQSAAGFVAIYPWQPTSRMMAHDASLTPRTMVEQALDLQLFQKGTPERNPSRDPYWTDIYQDPAGAGLMISHGRPVYDADRFLGVVAADIPLSRLHTFAGGIGFPEASVIVVDQNGEALAANSVDLSHRPAPLFLKELLPAKLADRSEDILTQEGHFLDPEYLVFHHRLENAPWSLIVVLPESVLLAATLFDFAGYMVIILFMTLFLIAVYLLLQKRFVGPAIALTNHIRAEAMAGKSMVAEVPTTWRPWFRAVSDTFALKTVTANLSGAIFQIRRTPEKEAELMLISRQIEQFTGAAPSELIDREDIWTRLLAVDDREAFFQVLAESARDLTPFSFECRLLHHRQVGPWVHLDAKPRRENGDTIIWEGLMLDITQRKQAEAALRASEERLRSILDASLFPIVISRISDKRVVFINQRGAELFGMVPGEGTNRYEPDYWDDLKKRDHMIAILADAGLVENFESKLLKQNGESFWALISAMHMTYRDEPCVLVTFNDISRRKQLEEELKRLATTDSLTGADNRRHFMTQARNEWQRTMRFEQPLSAVMMDIDHFKRINDTHGHAVGDKVIKSLANTCMASLRSIDIFGRLGGEEFCVILPNTPKETAIQVSERLRRTLADLKLPTGDSPIGFTVSVGVASFRNADSQLEQLLERADHALYEAKRQGRNRVVSE